MGNKMSLYPEPSRNVSRASRASHLLDVQQEAQVLYWWYPLLHWWYDISAPEKVPANASLQKREVVRRGRVASLILPVIIVLLLLPISTALGNPILLFTLALVFLLDMIALFGLNRTGHVTLAGILVVIGIEVGVGTSILTYPGGLGPSNLPLFDLLAQALVVAVAMLAPAIVFLLAGINSIFIVIVLHSSIISPALRHLVSTDIGSILPPPITLQAAIAWFTFILLRSTNQAIKRADRAEEFAALAQQNLELQQRELERTHQIEQGIEQMLGAMVRFANGDVMVRVPETQDNVLWKIGRSLNNLLARLKDYHRKIFELERARKEIDALQRNFHSNTSSYNELQRTKEAAAYLKEAIRVARSNHAPLVLPLRSGTIIDEIVMELHSVQAQQE